MFDADLTIQGLQELQDANLRITAALQPSGAAGAAVQRMALEAHRYLVGITHVDTGAYRASHYIELDLPKLRATITVRPEAKNPRTGKLVREYAIQEEARGGLHAAYQRTIQEVGPAIVTRNAQSILRMFP